MRASIFDFEDKLGYKSPFSNWVSPLSTEVKNKELNNPQATNIEGPSIVCEGAVYDFRVSNFSIPNAIIDFNKLLDKINWAYQIDNNSIIKINQRGIVEGLKNQIVLKWKVPKLNGGSYLKIFTWIDNPNSAVFTSSAILSYPYFFDRYKIKGLNRVGNKIADDMCYGDGVTKTEHFKYSKEEIEKLTDNLNLTNDELWDYLTYLITDVSVGKLEEVALKMVSEFKTNGNDDFTNNLINNEFWNNTLNEEVEKHEETIKFCSKIQDVIHNKLVINKCNPAFLIDKNLYFTSDRYGRPQFSTIEDTFLGGLRICLNDTWAYEVYITNFESNDGKNYNIKYKVILYDHFGLDIDDIKDWKRKVLIQGFTSWFVLQHLRNFKPFITKVEFEKSFSGSV